MLASFSHGCLTLTPLNVTDATSNGQWVGEGVERGWDGTVNKICSLCFVL
jgi:hypothetical protein